MILLTWLCVLACFPSDPPEEGIACGAGTVEDDGECVPMDGGADDDGHGSEGDADSDTDTPTETQSGPDAPDILTLGASTTEITEGESFTITAVVTDPQGIEDLIGGNLTDADGTPIGAFATQSAEGAYAITVSWAMLHGVDAIQFEDGSDSRVLRSTFYDQAGNATSQTVSIGLVCDDGSACDGVCTDTEWDFNNCGGCGFDCESVMSSGTCDAGQCSGHACVDVESWTEKTCSAVCASLGGDCDEDDWGYWHNEAMCSDHGVISYEDCDGEPLYASYRVSASCPCTLDLTEI